MKKKLLLLSLVLVMLLTALMPTAALARSHGRHNAPGPTAGDFSGTGLIYVAYMPPPAIRGKIWRYNGEIVQGYIQYCDWEPLAGAAFWSTHDSWVLVQNDGTAHGIMRGEFSLSGADGVMEGVFEGRIAGNLYTGFISDEGMWFSNGGSGVFENTRAWGRWSADLGYDPGAGTLIGPLNWAGNYRQR